MKLILRYIGKHKKMFLTALFFLGIETLADLLQPTLMSYIVDTVTEQRIRRAMLEVTKGRTSVIIAHRLSTIRDSDLILLMENGQIVEQGNHEQLMELNGRYAKMYLTQTGAQ